MKDPLSSFVEQSRKEPGERTTLSMKKEQGGAGFCLKVRGSPQAVKKLAEVMNSIDLSKHQPED